MAATSTCSSRKSWTRTARAYPPTSSRPSAFGPSLVFHPFRRLIDRLRSAEQIALHLVAAQEAQQVGLLLRLDSLRAHFQVEGVRQRNDRRDNRHLLRALGHRQNE